jgi:hypothetical protein
MQETGTHCFADIQVVVLESPGYLLLSNMKHVHKFIFMFTCYLFYVLAGCLSVT